MTVPRIENARPRRIRQRTRPVRESVIQQASGLITTRPANLTSAESKLASAVFTADPEMGVKTSFVDLEKDDEEVPHWKRSWKLNKSH